MTIKYATGRTYNTAQVLDIIEESRSTDNDGITTVVLSFSDQSRGIAGRTKVLLFPGDNLGFEVLAAYDAGRYQLI